MHHPCQLVHLARKHFLSEQEIIIKVEEVSEGDRFKQEDEYEEMEVQK